MPSYQLNGTWGELTQTQPQPSGSPGSDTSLMLRPSSPGRHYALHLGRAEAYLFTCAHCSSAYSPVLAGAAHLLASFVSLQIGLPEHHNHGERVWSKVRDSRGLSLAGTPRLDLRVPYHSLFLSFDLQWLKPWTVR